MPVPEEKARKHDTVEQQPVSTSASKSELETSDIEATASQVLENEAALTVPPPPDGGYGWVCVLACSLVNGFTWGVVSVSSSPSISHAVSNNLQSYGVYLAYYLSTNLYPSARPLDYAFLGGLNFGLAMFSAPFITILARKFTFRPVMIAGAIIQTLALCLASLSTEIWHLYLTQGALLGIGVGFAYVPSVAILSQWFEKNRSIASGIAAAGSGLGGVLYSFVTQPMIDKIGLPWTLRVTGLTSGTMLVIAAILMKSRNKHIQPRQHGFPVRLLKRYDVNLLLGWSFISMLGYIVLLFSLSDFARSSTGLALSPKSAANITAFLNLGTALGRPCIGLLSDRFGRLEVAGTITAVCALSVFVLWIPSTIAGEGLMIFFALICGATLGVFWVTIGPLCAEIAGLVELPSLLSLSWLVVVLPCTCEFRSWAGSLMDEYANGCAVSEVIAVMIRKGGKNAFLGPQLFAGFSYVIATFIMLELWRVHRKIKKQQSQGRTEMAAR